MRRTPSSSLALLLCFLLVLSLAACQGTSSSSSEQAEASTGETPAAVESAGSSEDTGEQITLEFWHSKTQPEYEAYYNTYTDTHPNVKINQTIYNDEDYKTQARVSLAGGITPDVWWMNTGSSIIQFVQSGGFMPLTEYADQYDWYDRFVPSAMKNGTVDDQLYALPWSGSDTWAHLLVNKTFFEENNLEYPVTIDDMVELAPKIRALGKEPMTFYDKAGWYGAIFFGDLILQQEGVEWLDGMRTGERSFVGDQASINALTAMKKLADAGAFTTGYDTLMQDTVLPLFKTGDTPIMYNAPWFIGTIGSEFDFEVETIEFFKLDPANTWQAYQVAINWALGVAPTTENPDAAVAFVDWAASRESHKMMASLGGAFSPVAGQNEEIDFPDFLMAEPIQRQFGAPWTSYFHYAFDSATVEVEKDQIRMVLAGQSTIDQALAAMDASIKEHQEENAMLAS